MEPAVVAEDLEKRYGDLDALGGVSLSIERGETVALIGPNGAGKTTLVRILLGTLQPDSGTVSILGSDPNSVDRERIGLLPQAFTPPDRLTGRELVRYYGGLYDDALPTEDALAAVGLDDRVADTRYENLSGGEQRRVCVACALVNDPDLLVLDEPTTAIDPAGRRSLWRLLERLADGGTTVLLTTHDMVEAERLADRVGLLSDGQLIDVGPPSELIAEHGGEGRLVVATEQSPDALDTEAFPIEATDSGVIVHDVPPERVDEAVRVVAESGITYDGLRWTGPTLEDVYLSLTGERFEGRGLWTDAPTPTVGSGTDAEAATVSDESTVTGGSRE